MAPPHAAVFAPASVETAPASACPASLDDPPASASTACGPESSAALPALLPASIDVGGEGGTLGDAGGVSEFSVPSGAAASESSNKGGGPSEQAVADATRTANAIASPNRPARRVG